MKTHADTAGPAERRRLIKGASYASVGVALMLAAAKGWAWQTTASISLLSSLVDSLLDVLASALTFWAVRASLAPADYEHRFGHGKAEGLAALAQAAIISGSGLYVASEAVRRLIDPAPVSAPALGIAVMALSIAMTLALVSFQRYAGRRTGSVAISADAMHYTADLAANLSVVAALGLVALTGWQPLDPLVGLGVAAWILRGALDVARQALAILLDREIPDADRDAIQSIARRHPQVHGVHDMKTRFGGSHYIVQFHLDLDPSLSLWQSHEILDDIEAAIARRYPGCEIIIHPDPVGFPETRESYE